VENASEENERWIRTTHHGKFFFSLFEGRRPSWCNLKVLQGEDTTLVILSQPQGYRGTFIVNAAEHIATQVTNLFGLDPATTMYIQYTPPTVPHRLEELDDGPLAAIARSISGPSDEKYERITFNWVTSDADEPILERYSVQEFPSWEPLLPREVTKLLQELNKHY